MTSKSNSPEACAHCDACLEMCICVKMGRPSISSHLARGDPDGSWICSNCWRCEEVCPKGLDIFSIMMGQRRVETPPPMVVEAAKNIKKCGCVYRIEDLNGLRKAHGLELIKMIDRQKLVCLIEIGQHHNHDPFCVEI